MATIDTWNETIRKQFTTHWEGQVRPRLHGLTDEEYLWEPVPGCWNVRTAHNAAAPPTATIQAGAGDVTIDFALPEPSPPPFTTIAWRLGHVIVGVLGERNAAHFDGPPISYPTHAYAGTAEEALAQLDEHTDRWLKGVAAWGEEGLMDPCGPAEGPFAEAPLGTLVLHINRELIHHLAEVATLRDLYRAHHGQSARSGLR